MPLIWLLRAISKTRDIPPYCVAVGNPAKVVRKRFDEELIGLLEETKWWDLPINEIQALIPILTSADLEMLKAELKKRSAKP